MVTVKMASAASIETIKKQWASRWQTTKLSKTSALESRRLLRQVRASHLSGLRPRHRPSRMCEIEAGESGSARAANDGSVRIRCCHLESWTRGEFRAKGLRNHLPERFILPRAAPFGDGGRARRGFLPCTSPAKAKCLSALAQRRARPVQCLSPDGPLLRRFWPRSAWHCGGVRRLRALGSVSSCSKPAVLGLAARS